MTTTTTTTTTTPSTSSTSSSPASSTTTSTTTAPAGPSADVALDVIARGQIQTGHGTGFQPGEIVTGVQRSVELDLGTQTADANGEVTFTWTIRTTETLGDHTFVVTGTDSGTASATFRVTAGGTLPATGIDSGIIVWALAALTLGGALVALTMGRRTTRR